MLTQQVAERATTSEPSLEERWERDLRCQHGGHSTDAKHHDPAEPASVRGVAPCGSTMNICARFAEVMVTRGVVVRCQCGTKHFAKGFTFVKI